MSKYAIAIVKIINTDKNKAIRNINVSRFCAVDVSA